MKIAVITAGAAGMFCGSCMKDNTLTAALRKLHRDATLVPTYMPIRTDEVDVSGGRVFYGGINVYLQEKSWLFRQTPRWLDRFFDAKSLLKWASKRAVDVNYADFADLTLSMLRGEDGRQKKELHELVDWLAEEIHPDVVILTNALLSGLVPTLKQYLGVPILTTLQGDDVFLDALPMTDRRRCIEQIRKNDTSTTAYIATSADYAEHMAEYLGLDRSKIDVVWPGIRIEGFPDDPLPSRDGPLVVGYFARICPEKGFHNVVDAFLQLRTKYPDLTVKLKAGGWKGAGQEAFFQAQLAKLQAANLLDDFEYVDCPEHADKVTFLRSLDVFSVPTDIREPKGLSVLEAWAAGVPVVQPRHGSFPELLAEVPGGLLYDPGNTAELAAGWHRLLTNESERLTLGRIGAAGVRRAFTAEAMARRTITVLERRLGTSVS